MFCTIETVSPVLSDSRLTVSKHYGRLLLYYYRRSIDSDSCCSRAYEIYFERKIRVIIILRFREIKHLEWLDSSHCGIECLTGEQTMSLPVYMTGCICRIHITYGIRKEISM